MHSEERDRQTFKIERRYLESRIVRLRRELADWPMTDERRQAKREELRALRVELLGARA